MCPLVRLLLIFDDGGADNVRMRQDIRTVEGFECLVRLIQHGIEMTAVGDCRLCGLAILIIRCPCLVFVIARKIKRPTVERQSEARRFERAAERTQEIECT